MGFRITEIVKNEHTLNLLRKICAFLLFIIFFLFLYTNNLAFIVFIFEIPFFVFVFLYHIRVPLLIDVNSEAVIVSKGKKVLWRCALNSVSEVEMQGGRLGLMLFKLADGSSMSFSVTGFDELDVMQLRNYIVTSNAQMDSGT